MPSKISKKEKYKRATAATLERRLRIAEAATAAGLERLTEEAKAEGKRAMLKEQAAKLEPEQEKALDLYAEAEEASRKANDYFRACAIFAEGYQSKAGKPPRAATAEAEACDMAALIYQTRKRLNLTQTELAEICGVTFATINRLENGHHGPNIATKRKIEAGIEKAEAARRKGK